MEHHPSASSSVYATLLEAAKSRTGKIAIVYEGQSIDYATLLVRIEQVVHRLKSLGVGQGDVFAVFGQNHPEHLFCYYAASKMGAVFVPVNPNLTAAEVDYNFRHSEAKVLFFDDHIEATARQAVPSERLHHIASLIEASPEAAAAQATIDLDDDFIITYSSGTTGNQKAIVLDQRAQIAVASSLVRMWGISEADTTLVALPLGYLYGFSTAAATALSVGGTAVILRRFHPRDVLAAFQEHRVTVYHGVPTMFTMMMEYCEQKGLWFDLSTVRQLICSGAPLPDEVATRFAERFGKTLQNYYAMTEVAPVFGRYHDDPSELPSGSIGRAAPEAVIKVLRPDGTDCGIDEPGEALVRGAATLKRYAKDAELTAASMKDGLFRSGDLVSRDKDGFYYIVGRIKEIIIRGGHNISPAEVEKALVRHPAVQDAAVVGIADRIFGEVPVAYVVLRSNASASAEELISFLETQVSDFKVPRAVYFVAEFPQGKTGKVDKKALKNSAEAQAIAV